MADPMISLRNVTKRYQSASAGAAVEDLSLDVEAGETVVLVGPSGCGKTTTMKMINRLIEPTGGTILVDGTDVMRQDPVHLRRGIGYVIQSIGLMPHRTVAQNMAMVPKLLDWDADRTRARIDELVGIFDLDPELLDRYPAELSGGQRQRVGVARALAADPPVMLMDEPFAAVDPIVRVTHDIDEAIKMADRIAILNRGAALEQYASPAEILRTPASSFVKDFVGAERGLKRLALIPISSIEVESGPVVAPGDTADEARRAIREGGLGWVSVVDDGELLGWVDHSDLEGASTVADTKPHRFSAYVTARDSLRAALDSIVTSETNVAVVVSEGQRYRGILTMERLTREIAQ